MQKSLYGQKGVGIVLAIVLLLTPFILVGSTTAAPMRDAERVDAANTVRISTETAVAGDAREFSVAIENDANVAAAEIIVEYDPSQGISMTNTANATERINGTQKVVKHSEVSPTKNKLTLSFVSTDAAQTLTPGTGAIFTVPYSLTATASGTISLTVSSVDLYDFDENSDTVQLESTVVNGSITVIDGTVDSMTPNKGFQGQTFDITIVGSNVHWMTHRPTVAFSGESTPLNNGITVNRVEPVSETEIKVNITIADEATAAPRVVTVASNGLTITANNRFTVEEADDGKIETISPGKSSQGKTIDVVITASDIDLTRGNLMADFGDDIIVNSLSVLSKTQAKVNIAIGSQAEAGPRTVTLSTRYQSAFKSEAFTVEATARDARVYIKNAPHEMNVGESHILEVVIDPGSTPVSGAYIEGTVDHEYLELTNVVRLNSELNVSLPIDGKTLTIDKEKGTWRYSATRYITTISKSFTLLRLYVKAKKPTTDTGTLIIFDDGAGGPVTDVSGPQGTVLDETEAGLVNVTSQAVIQGTVSYQWKEQKSGSTLLTPRSGQYFPSMPLFIRLYEPGTDNLVHVFPPVQPQRYGSSSTAVIVTRFVLPGFPTGTYDIQIKSEHSLINLMKNKKLEVGLSEWINFGQLMEGDLNSDGNKFIDDITIAVKSYARTKGHADFVELADLDEDGGVAADDMGMLFGNYPKQSPASVITAQSSARGGRTTHPSQNELTSDAILRFSETGLNSEVGTTHVISVTIDPQSSPVNIFNFNFKYDTDAIEFIDAGLVSGPFDFLLEDAIFDNGSGTLRGSAGMLGQTIITPTVVAMMTIRVKSETCGSLIEPSFEFPETSVAGPNGDVLAHADGLTTHCEYLPVIEVTKK